MADVNRPHDDLEQARCAARELWAALVVEWNGPSPEDSRRVGAVIRRWKSEFGTEEVQGLPKDDEGEHCSDCGNSYGDLIWWAEDDLWRRLAGGLRPALLCPPCFSRRAAAKGLLLRWRPEVLV